MFGDTFFQTSIGEIIGLIVTIVGIWLVVRQLHEARLASEMEGLITLANMDGEMRDEVSGFREFLLSDEWKSLDTEEAYSRIIGNPDYLAAYQKYAQVYELLGSLVRAGSLSFNMANEYFGYYLPEIYLLTREFLHKIRVEYDSPEINQNWEWIAKKMIRENQKKESRLN